MKNKFLKLNFIFIVVIISIFFSAHAYAIPDLQLYLVAPDATYVGSHPDPWIHQSWFTDLSSFELWVIAGVTFDDVNLVIAVPQGETGSISINSTNYSKPNGDGDFTFGAPIYGYTGGKDPKPKYLPPHGVYDTWYALHNIGPITTLDDEIQNMVDPYDGGTEIVTKPGKIIKFNVTKTDFSRAHFDAYGDGKFAPFSHDAQDGPKIPEPTTLSLVGMGILGIFRCLRRKI